MIPKIIHQTWKDKNVPSTMKKYVQSWKKHHPDFDYMFWTDEDLRVLIENHYPWFLPYFDSYSHQIMRVDAFRFFVLHHYGGIYADLDLESYKPINPLLSEEKLLLFLEWQGSVSNAVMASEPRHPFLEFCFKALMDKHRTSNEKTAVWELTGPKFLTLTFEEYKQEGGSDYKLYPHYYFFPIPWHYPKEDQSGQGDKFPYSYGAHHWQGTWWQKQPQNWTWLWITLTIVVLILISGLAIVVY